MKKIVGFKEGDTIPEGSRYLRSDKIPDYSRSCDVIVPSPGLLGLFSDDLVRRTPLVLVHYYEVVEKQTPSKGGDE